MLAVKVAFFDAFAETTVVNEVSTAQLAQKRLLFIIAHEALKLLDFNVKFFALNDVPTRVLTKETGECCCQEVGEPP